ncbi:hypothetical protein LguiA_021645 [Lonicera macranthoides]
MVGKNCFTSDCRLGVQLQTIATDFRRLALTVVAGGGAGGGQNPNHQSLSPPKAYYVLHLINLFARVAKKSQKNLNRLEMKLKGHPDKKLQELAEAAGTENRQNSWKLVKGDFLTSDHPQTLRELVKGVLRSLDHPQTLRVVRHYHKE